MKVRIRTTHIRTLVLPNSCLLILPATMPPRRRTQGKKIRVASMHDGITTSSRKKGKRGQIKDTSGRKSISIEVKLEIYEKKKAGAKNSDLAIEYGLAKSTISTIYSIELAIEYGLANSTISTIYSKQQVRKFNDAKLLCIQNTRPAIQSDLDDPSKVYNVDEMGLYLKRIKDDPEDERHLKTVLYLKKLLPILIHVQLWVLRYPKISQKLLTTMRLT